MFTSFVYCADMAHLQKSAGTIGWMNPAGDSVSASEFDTEFPVPCACVLIIIALYCGSNFSAQAISHASNSKF